MTDVKLTGGRIPGAPGDWAGRTIPLTATPSIDSVNNLIYVPTNSGIQVLGGDPNDPGSFMKILDAKMENVAATTPDIIATANVGCMLQLRAGVQRRGLTAEVVHVVELLDRAY